jgi:hypothetical protein
MKVLPKWIVIFGPILARTGALSWFSMIFPKKRFLIPLTFSRHHVDDRRRVRLAAER